MKKSSLLRRWTLMLTASIVVVFTICVAYLWWTGFFLEVFLKRSVLTPVVMMDIDLGNSGPQSQAFVLKYPGRYSVHLELSPRNISGEPTSGPSPDVSFKGDVEVSSETHSARFRRAFDTKLRRDRTLPKLLEFDASEVGIAENRVFTITFRTMAEVSQSFECIRVYVVRIQRYALLD